MYNFTDNYLSFQIEYAEKKKAEGKKMRDDKQVVLDMLFEAFEKHQYYNIKDLVKITRQPVVSLILFSLICFYFVIKNFKYFIYNSRSI